MPKDIDPAVVAKAFELPAEKAIEYLGKKGYTVSWDWKEVAAAVHHQAFTVAKVAQMDVLQDIRGMLEKAQKEGIPFDQFKKELEPKLKDRGWWGKAVSPEGKIVQLGSTSRLETIYRTNMQSAYMAGRYREMKALADRRPYWQYIAVIDDRTSDEHRALNGLVFRHDDPIWDRIYPPRRWRCRCRVRTLSEKQIQREGLKVTDGATIDFQPPEGWDAPAGAAWEPDLGKYPKELAKQYMNAAKDGPPAVTIKVPEPEGDPLSFGNPDDRDDVSKKWFGRKAKLTRATSSKAKVIALENDFFGRQLTREEYAGITGAPNGGTVVVAASYDTLEMTITHPEYSRPSNREIYRNGSGQLEMHNSLLMLKESTKPTRPSHFGTRIFATQVIQARLLGVELITVQAAGYKNHPTMNGYYTWPRLGYDGSLRGRKIPADLPAYQYMREVMADPKGVKWWEEHGSSIDLEFDLNDETYSVEYLTEYLKERGIKL